MAITVTSTTDTEDQVRAALGLEPETPASTPATDASSGKGSESGAGSGPAGGKGSQEGNELEDGPGSGDGSGAAAGDDDDDDDENTDGAAGASGKGDKGKAAGAAGDQSHAVGSTDNATDKSAKPRGGFQKRINKLTARNTQVETELQRQVRENLELRSQLAESNRKATAAAKTDKTDGTGAAEVQLRARPQQKDHGTYGDFIEDLGKWAEEAVAHAGKITDSKVADQIKGGIELAKKEIQQAQTDADRASKVESFSNANKAEAQKIYKDYDAKVTNNQNLLVSPTMVRIMHTHPLGHHFAYWMGNNPDLVADIRDLPEPDQLLEIGKVLAVLETKAKPGSGSVAAGSDTGNGADAGNGNGNGAGSDTGNGNNSQGTRARKSSAPKPIRPGSGKSVSTGTISGKQASEMSYQDYKKARQEGRLK